jgi:hypothetical protein
MLAPPRRVTGIRTTLRHRLKNLRRGQWCYRVELPADAAGKCRPRRRSGFADATAAQNALDQVRALLALPDPTTPTRGPGWVT